jgi:hypothetical protein
MAARIGPTKLVLWWRCTPAAHTDAMINGTTFEFEQFLNLDSILNYFLI